MRVFVLTSGGRSLASTRYRIYYLKEHLKDKNINYIVREYQGITDSVDIEKLGQGLGLARNLFYAAKCDLVLVQKVRLSKFHLNLLLKANSNVVYDIDDAMYALPPWEDGDQTEKRREDVNRVLRRVPYLIVGNRELEEYASQYCDEILVAPTALPQNRYRHCYKNSHWKESSFTIGWIGNEQNLWYLDKIKDQISRFLENNGDAELQVVTAKDPCCMPLHDRIGDDVHYLPWSEEKELDFLKDFDVAIRPLTDDEWTRAKGGFTSVIQCMAMGVPVIVSPIGMLSEIVIDGVNGYHATDPIDWTTSLNNLLNNPKERRQMGKNAFERVGEIGYWSHQRADDISKFYRSIMGQS